MKSIPGVGMRYRELNLDTTILAMPGGKCIKLEEPGKPNPKAVGFTIIDNKKEFYTTFSTAVDYLPWESIPQHEKNLWKNYLDLFLPADSVDDKGRPIYAYRKFVQKALGHMLIGGNPEKLAIFLVGIRDTGKSTIIHCIRQTLNDSSDGYGATFQPNSVFKDSNATNPELGNLLYKRGIFSSESGSQRIYANPFKRHTGGDEISVTRKWANEQIKGIPHFTMVIGTNQSPTIDDADEATTKRIMVCRFLIQVQPKQNDKRADVVIARDARHAILYWLLMGYRNYIRERLEWEDWHPIAKAATLEFASELSDVATYLSETVSVANDELKSELNRDVVNADHDKLIREWSSVSCGKLYDNYRIEAEQGGQKPLGARIFAKKVRQVFGVEVKSVWRDGKNAKHYLGLKWKNESAMSQIK
jgi:phage/plasmid-associated DNA primase